MRHIFNTDNFLITALVFVLIGALFFIPANVDFLNPLGQALGDFELTDLVFSQLRDENSVEADTNIVIVNIGELDRAEIAQQIEIINSHGPAVIGLDAFFRKEKTPELDGPLEQALLKTNNLVLASKLSKFNEGKKRFDSLELSHPKFTQHSTPGFVNVITDDEESFRTSREISFKENVGDSAHLSFAAQVVKSFKNDAFKKLEARKNNTEIINFRGNFRKFYALDVADVFDSTNDLSFLKGKIVLMGFLGENFEKPSLEDVFFTPLNEHYAGKSYPDMYGVVIHANVISMALHGGYIDQMPLWLSLFAAFAICFLNVAGLSYIFKNHNRWFGGETMIFQLLETIGLLFLVVMVFSYFRYKLDLTLAMLAVVLSSTVLDIYYSLFKPRIARLRDIDFKKISFKKKIAEIHEPENLH
ncbi:MAG: CHASE2 domain-containing protein [Bacteroidota bacterium]